MDVKYIRSFPSVYCHRYKYPSNKPTSIQEEFREFFENNQGTSIIEIVGETAESFIRGVYKVGTAKYKRNLSKYVTNIEEVKQKEQEYVMDKHWRK